MYATWALTTSLLTAIQVIVLSTASEVARKRSKVQKAISLNLEIYTELYLHRLIASSGPFDATPYLLLKVCFNCDA